MQRWETILDVVNCARRAPEVLEEQVYICPSEGSAYSHHRSKFFGVYHDKCVDYIFFIKAVVDVIDERRGLVLWRNVPESNDDLLQKAFGFVRRLRPKEFEKRVFLLQDGVETLFSKDTPGGMQGNKQYFDVAGMDCNTTATLARELSGHDWSQLPRVAF